ncbi:unnamed protein product [Lepidochelys kempii]
MVRKVPRRSVQNPHVLWLGGLLSPSSTALAAALDGSQASLLGGTPREAGRSGAVVRGDPSVLRTAWQFQFGYLGTIIGAVPGISKDTSGVFAV